MAWTGDVWRHIDAAKPDGAGSTLLLECGHQQKSVLPAREVVKRLRGPSGRCETICAACSKPNWDRIAEIRENITFDHVLEKIKMLR